MKGLRLYKYEKLCSRKLIDQMFAAKNNSIKSYPIRLIYHVTDKQQSSAQFFISVPKKRLRHAVDRVLMRRRIREAYRLNKRELPPSGVDILFVWSSAELCDFRTIEAEMIQSLQRIAAKIGGTGYAVYP